MIRQWLISMPMIAAFAMDDTTHADPTTKVVLRVGI